MKTIQRYTKALHQKINCITFLFAIVVMTSVTSSTIAHTLPKIVIQSPPQTPVDTTAKKISALELKKYAGDFVLRGETRTMEVKIFVEDGKLKVHPAGQNVGIMKYIGKHTFIHTKNADIRLVFNVVKGKADAVTLHQRGMQAPGKRKA